MNAAPASTRNDRTGVVDAAMQVLAENGLPGLSMRRIADVLDVQVSALYWHFPNKQTLLAAVSERIVALTDEAPDAAPDFVGIATTLHERLLAYRDGAELVSSSLALGLLELPSRMELVLVALDAGLDETSAQIAADTVVHYVIGYTFHEQQRVHAAVVGAADASADLTPSQIDDAGDAFDAGLAMVVAGVRATDGARSIR